MEITVIATGNPGPEEKHPHTKAFAGANHISFVADGTQVELVGTDMMEATEKVSTMTEGHLIKTTTVVRLFTGRITINRLLAMFADAKATVKSTMVEDLDLKSNRVTVSYTNEIVVTFHVPADDREMVLLAKTVVSETTSASPASQIMEAFLGIKPEVIYAFRDSDLWLNSKMIAPYLGEDFFTLA